MTLALLLAVVVGMLTTWARNRFVDFMKRTELEKGKE